MDNGKVRKTGEDPENPLLLIDVLEPAGQVVAQGNAPLGGRIATAEYMFFFTELRRWSGFMVVQDPGYLTVCVALWLGLGALILRYVPDLKRWFAERPDKGQNLLSG